MEESGIIICIGSPNIIIVYFPNRHDKHLLAIQIGNLSTPKLGNLKNQDEPGAWQLYDYLRQLSIGKEVILTNMKNKDGKTFNIYNFGTFDLYSANVKLKENGLDICKEVTTYRSSHQKELTLVRPVNPQFNPQDLLGKTHDSIIVNSPERVQSSFHISIVIIPLYVTINVKLPGVKFKNDKTKLFNIQCKYFNRSVKFHPIDYFTQGNFFTFYGQLEYENRNLSELLIEEGYGYYDDKDKNLSPEIKESLSLAIGRASKNPIINFIPNPKIGKVIAISENSVNEFDISTDQVVLRITLYGVRSSTILIDREHNANLFKSRETLRRLLVGHTIYYSPIRSKEKNRQVSAIVYGPDKIEDQSINEFALREGIAELAPADCESLSPYLSERFKAASKEAEEKEVGHFSKAIKENFKDISLGNNFKDAQQFLKDHYKTNVSGHVIGFSSEKSKKAAKIRAKIYCPLDNGYLIRFDLLGIDIYYDKISEALRYCNDEYLQRDTTFIFQNCNEDGTLDGSILRNNSLAIELANKNFGALDMDYFDELKSENNKSDEMFKKVEQITQKNAASILHPLIFEKPSLVHIHEIIDPTTFVLQVVEDDMEKINSLLGKSANLFLEKDEEIQKGSFYAAVYENCLYRVIITNILSNDEFECDFVEVGISDIVKRRNLRKLTPELEVIGAQSFVAKLFGVDVPNNGNIQKILDEEHHLMDTKFVYAHLMNQDSFPIVLLTENEKITSGSLNEILIYKGFLNYSDKYNKFISINKKSISFKLQDSSLESEKFFEEFLRTTSDKIRSISRILRDTMGPNRH